MIPYVALFPGQGSQWAAMAHSLLSSSEVFRDRLQECSDALAPYTDWSLLDVLTSDSDALERVEVVQPVLWAMMVSLASLWRAHGVEPAVHHGLEVVLPDRRGGLSRHRSDHPPQRRNGPGLSLGKLPQPFPPAG